MLTSIKIFNVKKILLIFILTLFVFNTNCFAVVSPTNMFYVNDYAGIIDSEVEEYIIRVNSNLYKETGAQIVVVTVNDLEGMAIEDYATRLFRNFKIGSSSKNNGVLMLLAKSERKFRIEVGYGLEGALPDGKTGRIQDEYIIPYLRQDDWNNGIKNGFNAILDVVCNEYGVAIDRDAPISAEEKDIVTTFLFGTIIAAFLAGVIVREIKRKFVMRKVVAFSFFGIVAIVNYFFLSKMIFSGEDATIFGRLMLAMMLELSDFIVFLLGLAGVRFSYGISGSSGYSSGGHSSGGFHGGGGSSGGGGSTRSF